MSRRFQVVIRGSSQPAVPRRARTTDNLLVSTFLGDSDRPLHAWRHRLQRRRGSQSESHTTGRSRQKRSRSSKVDQQDQGTRRRGKGIDLSMLFPGRVAGL
jgi:hypothetical protein